MIKLFGQQPFHMDELHSVPTPVGKLCKGCDEPIIDGDRGVVMICHGTYEAPWHSECHLRRCIGGYNHLIGKCQCCGGTEDPDPPGMTKRAAAKLAVDCWRKLYG